MSRFAGSEASWCRRHAIDLALVAIVLCITAPVVQSLYAQQGSRMALTGAIWDDGSFRIDGYPLGVDRAEHDGHTYSDKAPGQSVFGLPAYAVYRAVGGEPARVFRPDGNLGLWAVSVWSSALPAAALVLMVRRAVARVSPAAATPVALATALSTLLLPLASLLFGHVLGTALAFGGWMLATSSAPSRRRLATSGLLLGAAVLVEYTLVMAAVATAVYALWRFRGRSLPLILGGVPGLVALLGYQWAAFGGPFEFSYANSSFGTQTAELGIEKLDPPLLENSVRVLVGERGLFLMTPIIALGVVGIVLLIRQTSGHRRGAYLAAAASAASVIGVQMFWSNPTGGDSPGARYATAAAAFLSPGLAIAWERWRTTFVGCALIGGAVMVMATWTQPLESRDTTGAVGVWGRSFFSGRWTNTLFEMAWGPAAAGLLLVFTAAAAGWFVYVSRRLEAPASDP